MPRPIARTARLALAATLFALGCAHAGELARPVPSNAQVTRFTRFNIRYSIRDIIANSVQRVDFYISDDMGGTWRLYGEDPDKISPMTVEVPGEGVYGFVCVVTDRNGNREREPGPRTRPETVIVVDRTPPDAKWIAPKQDILGRGQTVELSWESSDAHLGETPVKIQYAANAVGNHDRNANWVTAQEELPPVGTYRWTPPDSQRYNLRLIAEDRAGNMAVAYCPATISVDSIPPVIRSVQPLRSNKLENDVLIDAVDNEGGSGVKEFSLYVSENGAATWTLQKEVTVGSESVPVKRKPGDVITFKAAKAGEYALWPVVFDEAGNATPLPSVGVAGPYILVIDTEPPVVSLSDSFLHGRNAILANDQRLVQWTAYDPHLQANSAAIALSLDNGQTWQELRSMLSTSGSETITFPFGMQSEDAKLRVTVRDEFGNVGESVSQSFKLSSAETTIDNVTPRGGPIGGGQDFNLGTTPSTPIVPVQPTPSGGLDWPFGSEPSATPAIPSLPDFPSPGAPLSPGLPPPAGGDIYGTGGDIYSSLNHQNESSASHLPQAMLGNAGGAGAATSSSPFGDPPIPPVGGGSNYDSGSYGGSDSQDDTWTPSAGADSASGSLSSIPSMPWGASEGTQQGTNDFPAWQPSGSGSTGSGELPWTSAPSPTPPTQGAQDLFGSSASPTPSPWQDGGSVTPPSLPQSPGMGDPSTPGGGSGLSFQDFGGLGGVNDQQSGLIPPAETTPQQPGGMGSSLRPPDSATAPSSPSPQPFTFGGEPQQPVSPALPGDTPPGLSGITPPTPLETATQRPASARQQSEHFVKESKSFRNENRPDLAKDSAEKAYQADPQYPDALMELSQVLARIDPPDFVRAANLAREATSLKADWETWWNCAEIFYTWSHASNREIQALARSGQSAALVQVDERNSTLNNAMIAINNAASVVASTGDQTAAKKVAVTQGMITYLRALTVPEPYNPGETSGPAFDEFRRQQATYKAGVTPLLQEALPFFANAMRMGGPPQYTETFQIGIINFRLAGLERDTSNAAQAREYYREAARYLEEATTAADAPSGGPREAYYMLALSHEQLAALAEAGDERARHLELALRYWRQTADFYAADTPYGAYARQRIDALSKDMGL